MELCSVRKSKFSKLSKLNSQNLFVRNDKVHVIVLLECTASKFHWRNRQNQVIRCMHCMGVNKISVFRIRRRANQIFDFFFRSLLYFFLRISIDSMLCKKNG